MSRFQSTHHLPVLHASAAVAIAMCSVGLFASPLMAQNVIDPTVRDTRVRPGGANPNTRQGNRDDAAGARGRNQPGLGGGTSLDRNLQRGSGGINAPIAQPNFASRNLISTGNVAGGRGFRGSVGYTAAGDFRSAAGSDELFRFQAESALSSTYFLTLRSSDRLSLAQDFGVYEFRRESSPTRLAAPGESTHRFRLDRAAATMASTRMFELEAEAAPFARGRDNANRNVDFYASTVQGMRLRRPDDPVDSTGLSTFEKARIRQDIAGGKIEATQPISQFTSPLFGIGSESERDAAAQPGKSPRLDTRIKDPVASQRSSYDQIVKRVLEQYGSDPNLNIDANSDSIARAKAELQKVRNALGGRFPIAPEDDPIVDPVTGLPRRPVVKPGDGSSDGTESPAGETTTDPNDKEAMRQREVDAAKASVSASAERLRHGTTIRDLSPGERSRVDELVRDGQLKLAEGDFFRSERCFTQALELNPDNPLLFAGLAHSQIGGGLHLSAALTLRTLFTNSPEMIDSRYERSLLPNETRIRLAVETLRKRIALGQDADGYGLTLAYLGHQLDEKDLVREGLAVFKGTIENDLMNELLSQLWLNEKPTGSTPPEKSDEKGAEAPAAEPSK
jgi:tetratricopeptide (TPR) repeat protein